MKNNLIWILLAVGVIGGIGWLWYDASRPLPGEAVADIGREHVAPGTKVDYNSNPPTSGNHYVDWIKKGVYSEPKDDGNLIHSLEHGYVIISYNCKFQDANPSAAAATSQTQTEATQSAEATASGSVSGGEDSPECKELTAKLNDIYKKKGGDRLIVVPRPGLDTKIALTAWTKIDKFNDFDEERITQFIDAFRNRGPEKTME